MNKKVNELRKRMASMSEDKKKQIINLDCLEEHIKRKINENRESNNNNISDEFLSPFAFEGECYEDELTKILKKYKEQIKKKGFSSEENLYKDVETNCDYVLEALRDLKEGKQEEADNKIKGILEKYSKCECAVTDIDDCYAYRFFAKNDKLNDKNKKELKNLRESELIFFRMRISEKKLENIIDIVAPPFSLRYQTKDARFSEKGVICLYMGITAYVCNLELCNSEELKVDECTYISAFKIKPKSERREMKILNFAISQELINGIYNKGGYSSEDKYRSEIDRNLQNVFIRFFPLVLATTFVVNTMKNDNGNKDAYLLGQSIMRNLRKMDIDGIGYITCKSRERKGFGLPYTANIAIFLKDINEDKEYSSIYENFQCTKPINTLSLSKIIHEKREYKKSFITNCYSDPTEMGYYNTTAELNGKLYKDTIFSKIENYLYNQRFFDLDFQK